MMNKTKKLTTLAMLAALSSVLMALSFNVPLMPSFIKMDFSEFPALIAACTMGPVSGVIVCVIKNLINLMFTTTGGVGELSNLILGALLVVPAGLICKSIKGITGAIIGSLIGAVVMAIGSVVTNYYIVYPVYTAFMPMEAILGAYKAINSSIDSLFKALLIFNMPFTLIKGMCSTVILILLRRPMFIVLKKMKISLYE